MTTGLYKCDGCSHYTERPHRWVIAKTIEKHSDFEILIRPFEKGDPMPPGSYIFCGDACATEFMIRQFRQMPVRHGRERHKEGETWDRLNKAQEIYEEVFFTKEKRKAKTAGTVSRHIVHIQAKGASHPAHAGRAAGAQTRTAAASLAWAKEAV